MRGGQRLHQLGIWKRFIRSLLKLSSKVKGWSVSGVYMHDAIAHKVTSMSTLISSAGVWSLQTGVDHSYLYTIQISILCDESHYTKLKQVPSKVWNVWDVWGVTITGWLSISWLVVAIIDGGVNVPPVREELNGRPVVMRLCAPCKTHNLES